MSLPSLGPALDLIRRCSPYLSDLLLKHSDLRAQIEAQGFEATLPSILEPLANVRSAPSAAEAMRILRIAKAKTALLVALADLSGTWELKRITECLSHFASLALQASVDFLLTQAAAKGEIAPADPANPSEGSGLIVLGMGKLGAGELNYSSDIDLILLFDREHMSYRGEQDQSFFTKLAHDLVRLMHERTEHGYVFRTDLRLRPDPASTPPALSVGAAMTYYETVGQNWERAALIKARPVAGDQVAGRKFLQFLAPFIWRRHLDFAAITDIQSIKRQMDSLKGAGLAVAGHNIKTGAGGIREIEFFVQIHQLIWGGRKPTLRDNRTCDVLLLLAEEELIDKNDAQRLIDSYHFFRKVEHRLQMVADQQTHTLPVNPDDLLRVALFSGFSDVDGFSEILLTHARFVHDIFRNSFRGPGELGSEGKLSFTGVEPDPDTLATLKTLGFENTSRIYELIAGWHRGNRRATRNKRARELITEVTPVLLKALAASVQPDHAFIKFDEFLQKLPAGVQLFSLFLNHPDLLTFIATIMGSAPALADSLARNPGLLDTIISGQFYRRLPSPDVLLEDLSPLLVLTDDYDSEYDLLRQFKNEKQFQIGALLLLGHITVWQAGQYLSGLCDLLLTRVLQNVEAEFARTYGSFGPQPLAVIALGRLGARELTFGSDLDLVFVYDDMDEGAFSGGEKSYNPNIYFARLTQRFIGMLTALTPQGRFYEIDTRLRPSGSQGPIAVSLSAFNKYFDESAWTFEYMALTRARVVTGNETLRAKLTESVRLHVCKPRDNAKLAVDALEMRRKVAQEFGTQNPWDIKHVRGGLLDLDFIAQTLVLAHAHRVPALYAHSTKDILQSAHGTVLEPETAQQLQEAFQFLTTLFFFLRLCSDGSMDETKAPEGQKKILIQATGKGDFEAVRQQLLAMEAIVYRQFGAIIHLS